MKRRDFLKTSLVIGAAGALSPRSAAADDALTTAAATAREFYELRLYHLRKGAMQKRFEEYCRDAAIPATTRAGAGPVGVFNVAAGPDSTTMYVLITYKSIDTFLTLWDRLRDDAEYQKAGADFINAPAADP